MISQTKLIILPGWEQSATHWQVIVDKLRPDFEVEVLEMPGFGSEPMVSTSWGVPEYGEWVRDKINNKKLIIKNGDRVVLLGHSFGGRVANYLACKFQPSWLDGLILYAAPVIYRPNWRVKIITILVKLFKKIIPTSLIPKTFVKLGYSDDLKNSLDNGKEEIFRRVVTFDQTEILVQNKYPTVLLWGECDTSVDIKIAHELSKKYPKAILQIIPNQGHNLHIDNSNLFYGILKQILANNF